MIWLFVPLKLAAVPCFPATPIVGQAPLEQVPVLPLPEASANDVAREGSSSFQPPCNPLPLLFETDFLSAADTAGVVELHPARAMATMPVATLAHHFICFLS